MSCWASRGGMLIRWTTTPLIGTEPSKFMRTKSIVNSCMLCEITAKFAQVPPSSSGGRRTSIC